MKKQWQTIGLPLCVTLGALLGALLLSGCASGVLDAQQPPTPFPTLPVTEVPPTATRIVEPTAEPTPTPDPAAGFVVPVEGELENVYPPLEAAFDPQVSGQLSAVHVRIGQPVAAGEAIASLDDRELRQAVAEAQLALHEAIVARDEAALEAEADYQRAVEDAEWAVEMARLEWGWARQQPEELITLPAQLALDKATDEAAAAAVNYKESLDRPWEPQSVRDGWNKETQRTEMARQLAELQFQQAQVQLEQHRVALRRLAREVVLAEWALAELEPATCEPCERAVEQTEAALAAAQEDLARAQLLAPHDGLVVAVHAAVGATIRGGNPIVTLLDVHNMHFVTLNLDERHAALVRPGQAVQITLRAFPETPVEGEVDVLLPGNGGEGDARFVVYIRLLDVKGLALLPGMTGRAEILVKPE